MRRRWWQIALLLLVGAVLAGCGETGSGPTPPAPPRASLSVTWVRGEWVVGEGYRVWGEVTNSGSATAHGVTVKVDVFCRGEQIDSKAVSLVPPDLAAGQKGTFDARSLKWELYLPESCSYKVTVTHVPD